MKRLLRILRAIPVLARDAVGTAGLGAVSYGFWMAWHPLGFIIGGLMGIGAAYLWARSE